MLSILLGFPSRPSMVIAVVATLLAGRAAQTAEPPNERDEFGNASRPKRVLIVTGEDHRGHRWVETAPVLKSLIRKDRRLAVDVVEDLNFLRTPRLNEYDVLVMHFKNYDPHVPGRAGLDNLAAFVDGGGGLMLIHFACGAFQEFKGDFEKLAGRVWNPALRGHDPYGEFHVEIVETEHPVTRGMKTFLTTDELYTCLDGQTPIELLAQARSKVDRRLYPMAFVLAYGRGRIFHTPLGHNVAALRVPEVGELIRRGTTWVAGLEIERSQVDSARPLRADKSANAEGGLDER